MADVHPPKKTWLEVIAMLTPLILGLLVTGVGAAFTQVYNYRQLQLNQLTALDKFRRLLVSERPEEREFAYASFAALGYEDLALKMISLKQDGAGRAVAQEISTSGSASSRTTANAVLATIPSQVYLHIGDESERAKSRELSEALVAAGFQPMGTENVAAKGGTPNSTQIRYFNEADKQSAEAVTAVLKGQGVTEAKATLMGNLKAPQGTIEIWLGKESK